MKKLFSGQKALLLVILAVALAAITLTTTVYAWLSTKWTSVYSVNYTTGSYVTPNFQAWIFDADEEETGESSNRDDGDWVSATTQVSSVTVLKAVETETSQSINEHYKFKSLHLGTVDNLLNLGNDNYFYVRFDITDIVKMGKLVKVGYTLDNDDITIYNADGNEVSIVETLSNPPAANTVTGDYTDLVCVECAISTALFSDPSASVTIDGSSRDIDYIFSSDNTGKYVALENGDDPVYVSETEMTQAYYLYVRISPDLEACTLAAEVLSVYMPCELTFDIYLNLEFFVFE